jgi:long-chain acyl-CoA synthetase
VPIDPTLPWPAMAGELTVVGARVAVIGGPTESFEVESLVTDVNQLLDGEPAGVVERDGTDVAVLIFTAGTAGAPKAAMLSHGGLLANIDQIQRHPGRAVSASDVTYGVLPLSHVFGITVVLNLTLAAGASVVLVDRFDARRCLADVARWGVTLLAGAPPMFAALAGVADAKGTELASVRLAVSGAAALPPATAEAFEARFATPVWEGYGLTEASPVVTSSVVGGELKAGSVGVPLPDVELRLIDDDGEDALVGDPGEVWVRGPNVFLGYWGDSEATASVLTPDGWLRTGDVAVADDDGYLYLVDRAKDLIIVSGFNVFPAEVEEVLVSHPDVAEAAVVGEAHEGTGEAVMAWVVAEPGSQPTEQELMAFCRQRLAAYKVPSTIRLVATLPRGLTGKLLRRSLHG